MDICYRNEVEKVWESIPLRLNKGGGRKISMKNFSNRRIFDQGKLNAEAYYNSQN
jgi:hypothetical protein